MGLFVRTIGLARATAKIGFANLVYNMRRLLWLERQTVRLTPPAGSPAPSRPLQGNTAQDEGDLIRSAQHSPPQSSQETR
jgi:hypothetical protein